MPHFIDYSSHVSKQTFSAAAITDSKGNQVGRIIIRFTDAQIGYNHHVGVSFYPADIDFGATLKGSTYSQPITLVKAFDAASVRCYDWHNRIISSEYRNTDDSKIVLADCMSRFDEIVSLKFKRKSYNLLWVM
jgi:hypothetical protein